MTFCNDDLKQVYHEIFDEALEAYNAGKKKTRDKIPDYYEHIRQSKQEKLFHEAIFQIGNLNDTELQVIEVQLGKDISVQDKKKYPPLKPL